MARRRAHSVAVTPRDPASMPTGHRRIWSAISPAGSPQPGSPLFLPWNLAPEFQRYVYQYMLGYLLVAALLFAWGWLLQAQGVRPIDSDEPALGEREA